MKGFFRRNRGDDEFDDAASEYETAADGLPEGVEPPPSPRLADIDWDGDVAKNAPLGIPQGGHPARPLPIEESAERLFNADMHELTKWGRRLRNVLLALQQVASSRREQLEHERAETDEAITATGADVASLRDQLADQDLKFPQAGPKVSAYVAAGTAFCGGLEVIALQPVIGQIVALSPWRAWGLTTFAVVMVGTGSWLLGAVLHRGLAHEGPRRIRKAHAAAAATLGLFATAALVGVVGLRIATLNPAVASETDAALAGLLYAAIQGAVQCGAMIQGWWHHNPRVRQLANTEAHLQRLIEDRDALDEAVGDVDVWADSLAQFEVLHWLSAHRAQLAQDYAAADLDYRNSLGQALVEAGHLESADILHILPLPKFIPPVETDTDDSGEWLTTGFMLPL